jgi:hypothetical protein
MTWGESSQCRIVRFGVSQCPTGGWRKHQGTEDGEVSVVAVANKGRCIGDEVAEAAMVV